MVDVALVHQDKEEIIKTAKQIGTFDISIEQVPDSCTVFAPNAPATTSKIRQLEEEEEKLSVDQLIKDMIMETYKSGR
jgi:thiamine biosynthesis protein ThiI